MRDLLTLYKLLWEQIKDKTIKVPLWVFILEMRDENIITEKEKENIILDISKNWNFNPSKKSFVQEMISKLENKE